MTVAKVLYTAKVHTTGGREGSSKSSLAQPVMAPILSNCLPQVGRPAS